MKKRIAIIAGILFSILLFFTFLPSTTKTTIKVGTLKGACGISFVEVLDALNLEDNFDIVMVPFEGVPLEVDALIKGDLDLAIIPVEFLKPNLKLLLMDMTQYQALIVKENFKSLKELRKIGAFTPTSTYLALRAYLSEYKLDNVSIVNVPIPALPDALQRGEVDAIASIGPTTVMALDKGGKVLLTFSDIFKDLNLEGLPPLITLVTTKTSLDKKGEIIKKIIDLREKAIKSWINSEEVINELYVKKCGLSEDLAKKYLNWLKDFIYLGDPLGEEVIKGIKSYLKLLVKHKILEIEDVDKFVNQLL